MTNSERENIYKALGLSKEEGDSLIKICNKIFPDNEKELIKDHCKCCKHFEYDVFATVDGIPLIVGHEMCNKWGNGCKTKEDGYCFLFEPKDDEET